MQRLNRNDGKTNKLSVRKMAEMLGYSYTTIYNLVKELSDKSPNFSKFSTVGSGKQFPNFESSHFEEIKHELEKRSKREKKSKDSDISEYSEVMTRQQCAKYLKISLSNLDKSDCPRIKLSTHAIRYRKSSVDQWLKSLECADGGKAE